MSDQSKFWPGPPTYPKPMRPSPTSIDAYFAHVPTESTRRGQVYDCVVRSVIYGMTRCELSRALLLPIQSICPPVWQLMRREVDGTPAPLLQEGPARRMTVNGHLAYVLYAITPESLEEQRNAPSQD